MSLFQTIIAILAMISLFLYGLKSFSKEVKDLGSAHFQKLLSRITRFSFIGFLFGAGLTAIIQSSSAITSITVALVDAGVIKFTNSLAVMLGTNVGTTSTAWLVTFKIGQIAPVFILLGTILSMIPARIQVAGKSLFYFGLILFSLELISQAMDPLKNDERIVSALALTSNHFIGVIAGIVVTAVIQSSSVTAGLAIILTQQGVLSSEGAIAIIIGSNVGTTTTALIASMQMSAPAKLAARSNFIFNFIGMLICFPFITVFDDLAMIFTTDISFQVAFAHLFFNVFISILMLPFLRQIGQKILKYSKIANKDSFP
jgi:phosphate:Na+ symporter